ncbi:MAG: DUF4434 domain-containing protein [Kiritimatiellae bacterium]|nr:DUF4434 domain-containing protein [Kiritimatiellia bacterium]
MRRSNILFFIVATWLACSFYAAAVPMATFVQLNRGVAEKTVDEWSEDMVQMKGIGVDTVILQWSAEAEVSYVVSKDLPQKEQYSTVDRILKAAADQKMKVYLGLHHDPHYWTQITARKRVLRDYFLVRVVQNKLLQKVLLEEFGDLSEWVGYYIPDELDDLTWRQPGQAELMANYIKLMCKKLRANDAGRKISVSAFFRGRTAPDIFMANMQSIVAKNTVDNLLLQDGAGLRDPSLQYTPIYYAAFKEHWPKENADLSCVVELFKQESKGDAPFRAVPASVKRVRTQLKSATEYFDDIIFFTFSDYADPDLGGAAKKLYKELRK